MTSIRTQNSVEWTPDPIKSKLSWNHSEHSISHLHRCSNLVEQSSGPMGNGRISTVARQAVLNFSPRPSSNEDDEVTIAMTEEKSESLEEKITVKCENEDNKSATDIVATSPCGRNVRDLKQAVLTPTCALSTKPVQAEQPRRRKARATKKPGKSSRNKSAEPHTPVGPTVARPRVRPKACSVSPKKNHALVPAEQPVRSQVGEKKEKRQTQLTTYGIRRTARQCAKDMEREREANVLMLLRDNVQTGMKVIVTEEKGRGVVATRVFHEGEFVVEYAGELISEKSAKAREQEYKRDPAIGSYMFYFCHNGVKYCVDATEETPRLGRLVNHSRLHPNCLVKVVPLDNVPRLVLFARQIINPGEELLYDYGDRDKESLEAHPWLRT
ncbi:unnamed protein product [Calicophoron daubneyi]|uniref:[histone H4]-lysine(20) N-methyltransferase n=1 Tax=Calicophoron daubneyi TaxID=300641 RepID=A0AAV2T868_CALDB